MRRADQFVQSTDEYRECSPTAEMQINKIFLAHDHPGL